MFRLLASALFAGWVVAWAVAGNETAPNGPPSGLFSPADAPFPVPEMTPKRDDVEPFRYVDVGKKIPNYQPGKEWGAQGEPFSRMQEPLSPVESLKHIVVPRGFHVELFAAEPDLGGKPIAMNWDERGRLWVAETYDYPNELQSAGEGRDRIRICEDTDRDGRADKFTVFAEQLSIPSSLTFSRGGAIVFDGTQTVFLKDTNGDDVADERRVLFGTWSQKDTHGGPNNMQYGLDNWIWAMQGYNDSRLEVGGQKHQFRQGFLRFKPDGTKLEFLRSTDNNTWGLGISEEGIAFGSTANRNPSVHMPIPNRYYERVRGWTPSLVLPTIAESHLFAPITDKVRQVDHFGGHTAAAGHALYTARRYPRQYWNRTALVCEPTGHLVGTFVIARDGSGFRSASRFNLFASDDEWTAPVMAEVGPDGNVWVIDWYNYVVQHNPTPIGFKTGRGAAYESDLRDKLRGRIYRVVYDGPEEEKPLSLADATAQKLISTLVHPNLFWRRHAQRLLVQRGQADVVPALVALAGDPAVDEIGLNVGAMHALWTLHGLGALDGANPTATAAAIKALRHPSAGVRRNAVQVLPQTEESAKAILAARLCEDDDPQVRLAALLALADCPPVAGLDRLLVSLLCDPANVDDRWIREAAICAAATDSNAFLAAIATAEKPPETLAEAATIVAEHRARSGPFQSIDHLVGTLATMDPRLADAVVRGLVQGWPADQRPSLDAGLEATLEALLPRLSLEGRSMLVQLAIRFGSQKFERYAQELAATLLIRASDESLAAQPRIDAARELVALRSNEREPLEALVKLITPRMAPELAGGILRATAGSDVEIFGASLIERQPAWTPEVRSAGISVLLSRLAWTKSLLDALAGGNVQWSDLSLHQRQSLIEHPDRELRKRSKELLERRGALPNPDRRKVLEELLPLARQTGDAARGKQMFIKQCAKCHVHGSEGARIGPDLTGVAVRSKEELLDNIIDPTRSVEGNFRVYTVSTSSGLVLTGLLASESKSAVELFDTEGKKHQVLREDIDELVASPKSLMPEGFEKQLTPQDLVDLVEFLASRGKFLPLPLDKVATAVSTRGMFEHPDSKVERLAFDDWSPKTFAGVPFQLVDPRGDRVANAVLLFGPQGLAAKMPKSVSLPCHAPARRVHLLGGVSGWGHPLGERGSVSLIVRLHYEDGTSEDHELANGEHLADYIRRVDVPGSQFAFDLDGRQLRYLAVEPKRPDRIDRIELVKGPDGTAPVVMAVTIESP
jgi:hypothetical protein